MDINCNDHLSINKCCCSITDKRLYIIDVRSYKEMMIKVITQLTSFRYHVKRSTEPNAYQSIFLLYSR